MTTILIIEDERAILEEVAEWLDLEGYDVYTAINGLRGLEVAHEHKPDLIICDIQMPEMDGFNVLLEVRSSPDLRDIPFIFLTASAEYDTLRKGMRLGADDYLTKPFRHSDLLGAIQSRLERKAIQEKLVEEQVNMLTGSLVRDQKRHLLRIQLMGMLSHELRNSLTSIVASGDLLRRYGQRMTLEQQHTHIDRMQGSAYQVIHTLDDILTSVEIENGMLAFHPEMVDVCSFLDSIVSEFQLICKEHHMIIVRCGAPCQARIDRRLFRQILSNLLSNAIKYSPSGGKIQVSLLTTESHLKLVVEDQGIGISPQDLPHVFNLFYRTEEAQKMPGSGLGLPIVKQAVSLHQGSVHVESEPGKGTRFTIIIPGDVP